MSEVGRRGGGREQREQGGTGELRGTVEGAGERFRHIVGRIGQEAPSELVHELLREAEIVFADLGAMAEQLTALAADVEIERQRYRELFDFAPDAYLVTDLHGVIREANHAACNMLGTPVDQLLGTPLVLFIEKQERSRFFARLGELGRRDVVRLADWQVDLVRRSGARFPASISAGSFHVGGGRVSGLRWLLRDITAQVRAYRALQDLTAELQMRNQELDAFAHTMAHQMKNPLMLVRHAETLEKQFRDMSEGELQESLHVIAQSSRWMNSIINEMLLLAEIDQGEVPSYPLEMEDVVQEALKALSFEIEQAGAQVSVPDTLPGAAGYAPWVEQVWINYLDNALKHGGHPPRLEIQGQELPHGTVRFAVRDHGPGIVPEDRDKLFAACTHLPKMHRRGHGLGLSIVRHIVERLGGEVGCEDGVHEGAIFWFTLPAPKPRGE